jgi:hypothetical protein
MIADHNGGRVLQRAAGDVGTILGAPYFHGDNIEADSASGEFSTRGIPV